MTAAIEPAAGVGGPLFDAAVELVWLDPRALVAHPRNVRTDLGDLTGLAASIAEQGVIEPLVVIPIPGGHEIVAGHRRAAAAVTAEQTRVPCVIRRDLDADGDEEYAQAEQVGVMLAENLHRRGLSAVEEARGVQTMLDVGMPVERIAKRTGLSRDRVEKAARVAELSEPAAAAVVGGGLTLDQAADVAPFADDPGVVEDLVIAAEQGPGEFRHALSRAEQDRQAAQQVAARRAELEQAGRRVLLEEGDAVRLSGLLHDGQVLDAERHADCPGAAVALVQDWRGDVFDVEVCTDPAGNGHVARWGRDPRGGPGASMTDEELERQRAERREVIENNKAMDAANAVRRAWLREYLDRRRAPRELLRWCVETLATAPRTVGHWLGGEYYAGDGDQAAAAALGLNRPRQWGEQPISLTSGEHVTDARLPLQLFAHIAGAWECSITRESWRKRDHRAGELAGWLTFLAGQGYTLAPIEQQIVDAAAGEGAA